MKSGKASRALEIGLLMAGAGVLYGASLEFHNIAWGTGTWIGQFSFRWGVAYGLFIVLCILSVLGAGWAVLRPGQAAMAVSRVLCAGRSRLRTTRWLAVLFFLSAPVWFLQYSPWGVVFSGPFSRLLIWGISGLLTAFLLTRNPDRLTDSGGAAAAAVLSGASFVLAAPFMGVSSYPFSLGWSEGNRLWDYSLLFGKNLYRYSPDATPQAYLDFGRQLAGGLPFVVPHLSILAERLWLAGLSVLPYLVLGWLVFLPNRKHTTGSWLLAGIWGFMFLSQGPIHTPLLVCAMLTAVACRQRSWLAAILTGAAGYFAAVSRFTWVFAPAMWAAMLEVAGASLTQGRISSVTWKRAIILSVAGLVGGGLGLAAGMVPSGTSAGTVTTASTNQPLLWYRLFPNATYGDGILYGLLIAAGPLLAVLIYIEMRCWRLNLLQKLSIVLPLLAFLAVGLIVSTKIGGGGDLHNMDMFLIGLMFTAGLAWRAGDSNWLTDTPGAWGGIRVVCILLVAVPAFPPLMSLRPLSFAGDVNWLAVLADAQRPRDLGSLPSDDIVLTSLRSLRAAVTDVAASGDILFMDQRQLLTFGYIRDVQLVSAYEKKRMMDAALSADSAYFQPFYRDLASHRFPLIISSPLRTPIRDSEYGFGEENNAWVKWVAKPILCYYEEKDTLTEVKVELLVPRSVNADCAAALP